MEGKAFEYKKIQPDIRLIDYVESFWLSANHTEDDKEIVLFPDGRVDIIFTCRAEQPFTVNLFNLDRKAKSFVFTGQTRHFAISLKLIGAEYLLDYDISNLESDEIRLTDNFLGITDWDLKGIETFAEKVSEKLLCKLPEKTDERKLNLFKLIYGSNGAITVKELSEKLYWSSLQINRYFKQKFGITPKTYCSILRFRATFNQIKEGKLYPEQNFADQSHFIREIKKFSSFIPKELAKNKNDRFIQFSALPKS